jgi:uncharacterized NAD(P)/FAD-binding protein YdhS
MRSPLRTIVIVGAGFCGTALATQLLRTSQRAPLRIVLIERRQFARGAAYGRTGFPHLLNVPAGRMSANPLDALEFVAYARRRAGNAQPEDFLPRELYGEYLEASLAAAEIAAASQAQLERIHDQVIAIERPPRSGRLQLHLEGGGYIEGDCVVLAPGNPAPAQLPGQDTLRAARYVNDPWASPLRFRANESLLLVGTGLTMADMAVAATRAAGGVQLHALSRHGLLPAAQTHASRAHEAPDYPALLRAASASLTQLVHQVRSRAEDAELSGGDWRDVITGVRDIAPAVWARLRPSERRRFLRHVRAYWDVHRHRLALDTWASLQQLRRDGALEVHAGRLLELRPCGKRVRVLWRPRGERQAESLTVDRVINCTGPDYDLARTRDRLLRSLLAQGLVQRDPLGVGLVTASNGAVVDASGRTAANLYYLGPMLRAMTWESTAVAELREHAAHLAHHLSAERQPPRATLRHDPQRLIPRPHLSSDPQLPLH